MPTWLDMLLRCLVLADAALTVAGFALGAHEVTPGYRRLPRWAIPTLRIAGLALWTFVVVPLAVAQGHGWAVTVIVLSVVGCAVAVYAVVTNIGTIRRLRRRHG